MHNVQVYKVKEVAEMFRVSMQAVRNMISRGQLAAVKIGKDYRIPVSEVDRILNPQENGNYAAERIEASEPSANDVFAKRTADGEIV